MYTPTSQPARLIIATATITQIPKVDCVVRTASTIAGPPTSTIHPATYPPRPPGHPPPAPLPSRPPPAMPARPSTISHNGTTRLTSSAPMRERGELGAPRDP